MSSTGLCVGLCAPSNFQVMKRIFLTSVTRFNSVKSLSRIDPTSEFEDFFRGFGMRPAWSNFEAVPDMRLDVSEDDKAYRVKAEIPGVDKKDIELSINGNQIAISAEVKREMHRKENEKDVLSERYYGKVYRAFSTPLDVDASKAEAHYDNGVLTLTLPKKANGSSRKIAIN